MKTILATCLIAFAIIIPILRLYLKERKARVTSERALAVLRLMGEIDDRIHRMRQDNPDDWPHSYEAQMLIVQRIMLHEERSAFLGHQPLGIVSV